ncbi:hypothetical protein [Bradyrhizobium sp. SZCCHNRI1009]|uniref:hypothetical protein n=1 Tax=Bradyrhizobium sp. SZCCHNRI1009 TaxID=3057277 RepID=UPI00291683A1|nr:hypothetical protein [Bradyrhizobium sp. SZCCHNRI1009]
MTLVAAEANGLRTYFSEEVPLEIPKPQALSSMDQIVLARVRVLDAPAGLLGFEQSAGSGEAPHEYWSAWLRVLAVLRGKRPELERVYVTFGNGHSYARGPTTPRQLQQDYFVAMYEDDSGFHLIGVPIAAAKYTEWQQEIGAFERERVKSLLK